MNILVCIKQVPGSNRVEVDPETGVLKRDGVASKMNPYDLYALELAFSLAERYGGEVQALSMGPPQAKAVLLEAVYMGASRGTLVSDRAFAGADVLSTSYTLSQAVKKLGPFDLILCGKQTTDGDTAQVGAEVAEFLNLPHGSYCSKVLGCDRQSVTVEMNLESSVVEQRIGLPCLLCTDGEINTPRLPSYRRRLAVEQAGDPVTVLSLRDFDDQDPNHYGLNGSPTQVERIFPPEKNDGKQILEGEGEPLADQLYELLRSKKLI